MLTSANRSTAGMFAAAALITGSLVSPLALAQTAGTASGISDARADATTVRTPETGEAALIAKAGTLADAGRIIEAQATLAKVLRPEVASTLTEQQQKDVVRIGRIIDGKLRSLEPVEVSLQKAELAVSEGDLRFAERQATAVLAKAAAGDAERDRARKVLEEIAQQRTGLAPLIDGMLQQAVRDFEARNYAAAKTGLSAVIRAGVQLSPQQNRLVDQYQMRIVELETASGASFEAGEADAALGMIQPGTVRRGGNNGGRPDNSQPPADPPAAQPPEGQAPPAQPEAQPSTPTPPAGNQEDLIQAALRAEAQRILAEAELALRERRYREAVDKFTMSTTTNRRYLAPDQVDMAEQRLQEARSQLEGAGAPANQIPVDINLQRQRAQAEFDNLMAQAGQARQAGNTARARELAASARLVANQYSTVFSAAENEEFQRRVSDEFNQIDVSAEQIRKREAEEREAALVRGTREAEQQRTADKERKIAESIDRIRALQQELKYEEALQVVDQVLFLDPINPTGLLLRDALSDIVVYRRYWEIQRLKQLNHAGLTLDAEADMIPPKGIIDYPADWPAKTFQRGEVSAYAESPEDRRVLADIGKRRIPVDFSDNTLTDVLSFLETVAQVSMDVDWDSLNSIGIQRESLVTLKLSNVPVRVALDRVLQKVSERAGGLSKANWSVNDGILMIASDDSLRKQTNLVIYNVTDLLIEIPNYYDSPEIDLQGVLQQSGGGGGGGGQSPFRNDQQQQRQREELEQRRRDRLTQIQQIITSNVDFEGWRDNGGDTGMIQELNGSLIIRNTPRNHREITGLLSKLREIRSMQINVETKFLLVNQNWFEQIGFDIDVVLNANNNQVRAARGNDPSIQAGDFFNFNPSNNLGQPLRRQVIGQGSTTGVTPAAGLNDSRTGQAVVNPRGWSPIGIGSDSLGLASSLVEGDFASAVVQRAPALGIAGQFLDDIQVDFLITATQADKRSVQLTAPRLTFTNGQTANIFVVTQQAFISDLEPVVGDSAVGFDPEVAVVSEGVTMLVEGVISADRRYVTLNVDAGVSRIDGFAQQPVTAVAGGQLVNSADTQSFIQLPTVTVTRVRTTVTVPDEGTVLLGGQRLITELEIETGVPVLSKIPIINRFFTNRIESKDEQTLLILIKPTVLIQSEEEERQHPGLADQMRTGLGMQ